MTIIPKSMKMISLSSATVRDLNPNVFKGVTCVLILILGLLGGFMPKFVYRCNIHKTKHSKQSKSRTHHDHRNGSHFNTQHGTASVSTGVHAKPSQTKQTSSSPSLSASLLNMFTAGIFFSSSLLHFIPDANDNNQMKTYLTTKTGLSEDYPYATLLTALGFLMLLSIEAIVHQLNSMGGLIECFQCAAFPKAVTGGGQRRRRGGGHGDKSYCRGGSSTGSRHKCSSKKKTFKNSWGNHPATTNNRPSAPTSNKPLLEKNYIRRGQEIGLLVETTSSPSSTSHENDNPQENLLPTTISSSSSSSSSSSTTTTSSSYYGSVHHGCLLQHNNHNLVEENQFVGSVNEKQEQDEIYSFSYHQEKQKQEQGRTIAMNEEEKEEGLQSLMEEEDYDEEMAHHQKRHCENVHRNHYHDHQPHDHHHHHEVIHSSNIMSLIVFLSLAVHSFMEGLGIGAQEGCAWDILFAILAHKSLVAFSMGVDLINRNSSTYSYIIYITSFSILTPLGLLFGWIIITSSSFDNENSALSGICTAISGGTFLFVSTMEVIPNELKNHEHTVLKLLALCVGFLVIAITSQYV